MCACTDAIHVVAEGYRGQPACKNVRRADGGPHLRRGPTPVPNGRSELGAHRQPPIGADLAGRRRLPTPSEKGAVC